MARIPDLEYSAALPEVVPRQRDVSNLEVGLGLAGQAASAFQRMNAREQETKAAQASADFSLRAHKLFEEKSIAMQDDPAGFGDAYLEALDKEFNSVLSGNPDADFQNVMRERYRSLRQSQGIRAASWETSKRSEIQLGRLNHSVESLANLVFENPTHYASALSEVQGNFEMAKSLGIVPNAEQALAEAKDAIGFSAFKSFVDRGDLQKAEGLLNDETLGGSMQRASDYLQSYKERVAREQLALQEKAARLRQEDPIAWAESFGGISFSPLVGEDGALNVAAISERAAVAEQVGTPYLLKNEEASLIAAAIENVPEKDGAALLSAFSNAIDDNASGAVATQLAAKNKSLAVAFDVSRTRPDVAEKVLRGSRLAVPVPSRNKFYMAFMNETDGLISSPQNQEAYTEAIMGYYKAASEARLSEGGDLLVETDVDESILREAVESLLPPVMRFGNGKTLGFIRPDGTREDDALVSLIDLAEEVGLPNPPVDKNGAPYPIGVLADRADWVPVSNGRYATRIDGVLVPDASGRPFIFDVFEFEKYFEENFESEVGQSPMPNARGIQTIKRKSENAEQ